jgi:hypothetical protein
VIALQRTVGNQAVARLLTRSQRRIVAAPLVVAERNAQEIDTPLSTASNYEAYTSVAARESDEAAAPAEDAASTTTEDEAAAPAEDAASATTEDDPDFQSAIQALQSGGDTMTGQTIGITPDLVSMLLGRTAQPSLPRKHRKKFAYKEFKGDVSEIRPGDIQQGELGDCYLLSAMAAIAAVNPAAISRLIKDNGDGTYDITLYVRAHFWSALSPTVVKGVTPTFPATETGQAAYAQPGHRSRNGPEIWPMLIEKAYATLQGGYDEIIGGFGADAMEAVTGKESKSYSVSSFTDQQMMQILKLNLDAKYAITAGSDWSFVASFVPGMTYEDAGAWKKHNIVASHEYAVKSVNVGAMTLDLKNPWGANDLDNLPCTVFRKYFDTFAINPAQ